MSSHRMRIALLAAAVAALGAPASANAAVTIGSNLASDPTGGLSCGVVCTESQVSLPATNTAAGRLFAPSDGIVVRWRIKVGSQVTPVAFRITRSGNSAIRTGVGTGPTVIPAPNAISEYAVQLPIRAGDAIGIDCCETTLNAMAPSATAARAIWSPRLQDGEPPRPGNVQQGGSSVELLVNADIEPDCDADGLGDETQDPELPLSADCGRGNRALTLDANKNKVKKGKKVTLSGRLTPTVRQGPCESGQTVELQRKRPSDATFTTFAAVQTNAQGSFSLRRKVKKTFEYRAQVVETGTCTAALSNSEKVKAKKKKK